MVTKQILKSLMVGTRVVVKVDGALTPASYDGWSHRYDMAMVRVNGRTIPRRVFEIVGQDEAQAPQLDLSVTVPATPAVEVAEAAEAAEPEATPINVRFQYLEQLVTMVSTSVPTSMVVVGSGGLGKSYTVFQVLERLGLEEDHDYVVCRGMATPKSLYRMLYENRDKIVVFDDCDSVLSNDTAVNLLKAALDTVPVRTVSWRTERNGDDDSSLPASFQFDGKIIFISNFKLERVPQALLSRALSVDVTMTPDEKIERMRHIAPVVNPDIPLELKLEVIDLLNDLRHQCRDLNCRTLLKVCAVRQSCPDSWRGLARYVITSGSANS